MEGPTWSWASRSMAAPTMGSEANPTQRHQLSLSLCAQNLLPVHVYVDCTQNLLPIGGNVSGGFVDCI